MSEETKPTYVAIISLKMPGGSEKVSANVTLLPQDVIPADGRYKHLHECTLADLQAFADQLEAEVWETYQEIKLVELAKDEQLHMEMTIHDAAGDPIAPDSEWLKSVMVVVGDMEAETAPDFAPAPVETEAAAPPEAAAMAPPAPAETPDPEAAAASESAEPNIIVAETELVHEEPEVAAHTAVTETPTIAPSRARVRIAGQRRPIGDITWTAVDIFIEEPALRAAQAHADRKSVV